MKLASHALPRFWSLYDALPEQIREQADKQYTLFLANPFHPSLHLKPVGPFWSVRVSRSHRALAMRKNHEFFWFWIGSHEDYEKFLGGAR